MNDEDLLTENDLKEIAKYELGTINHIAARGYYITLRSAHRRGERLWNEDGWLTGFAGLPELTDQRTAAEKEGRSDLEARRAYQRDWVARKRARLAAENGGDSGVGPDDPIET
jgi:hypothetical protein